MTVLCFSRTSFDLGGGGVEVVRRVERKAFVLLRATTTAESLLAVEVLTILPLLVRTTSTFLEAIVFGVLIGFGTGERDER
jgi:hypothetical protein